MNEQHDPPPNSPEPLIMAEVVPSPEAVRDAYRASSENVERPRESSSRWALPLGLYVATILATIFAGALQFDLRGGLQYSAAVMIILTFHEMGHYVQARRYGVSASLPYFLPLPISPFGTMGAVIRMDARIPNRVALYDIGITGPLAGLVPALACCVLGLHWSELVVKGAVDLPLGQPLLFQLLAHVRFGAVPPDLEIAMHPVLLAGWVGLFITSLNLLPIGQLDGGHVLYAMLGRWANLVALILLTSIAIAVFALALYHWFLMLALLFFMGARHPPTHDDDVPLRPWRYALGWCTLAFLLIGFTPAPLVMEESPNGRRPPMYAQLDTTNETGHADFNSFPNSCSGTPGSRSSAS